jgi:hypothetical protein
LKTKELFLISSRKFTILAVSIGLLLSVTAIPSRAQVAEPPSSSDEAVSKPADATSAPTPLIVEQPAASDAELPAPSSSFPAPAPPPPPASDLHFSISPYLWFPGVHGSVGAHDTDISVHASAGDLLSHFRFGLMGTAELDYKRFVIPLDFVWVRLGDDKAIPDINDVANLKAQEFILTPKVGYRVIDNKMIKVDGLAGFRYWHYGQSVSFTSGTASFSTSQNWVDPLVGARFLVNLSPKVVVTVAGDVGGWGAGSQLDYQIVGLLGYRLKPAVILQAGYRYLYIDYRDNARYIQLTNSGVVFGATIYLK